jgi:single-strand DNA-binding protein
MVNNLVFQGRLTADPELKQTGSGVPYIKFTIAWSKKVKEVEKKCFLRCTAWRSTAEMIAKYFVKGQEIAIVGELETNEYTDQSGQKRSETVANVNEVNFCGNRADKPAAEQRAKLPYGAEKEPIAQPSMPDFSVGDNMEPLKPGDDLPF